MPEYAWFDIGGRQVFRRVRENIPPARSDLPIPMFIRDEMDPTEHPHDGREYTSKSAFRRVTKANGYIEVGDDQQRFKVKEKAVPNRKEIRASLERAKARVNA